jgi:hypothetical protein
MRWNRIGFLGLIFLLASNPIQAQVELIDLDRIPIEIPSELQLKLESEVNENTIISWYASQGYLDVQVKRDTEYVYQVEQGCKFDATLIAPNDEFDFEYSESELQLALDMLLELQAEEGKYFSSIEIQSFNPIADQCIVEIFVEFTNNEEVFLRDITFQGNRLNSVEYLRKRSYFSDSLLATTENLRRLSSNIRQTELFESVSDPQVFIRGDQPIISFDVQERALNQFDGVLGYVPDAAGNGQVVGDLSLSLWSVFADGNGVDLDYRRLEPEVSRLNLGVSQHWFGTVPLGITAGFNFFQNDTTYQARDILLDGYFELGNGLQLIGDVGLTSITGSNISRSKIEPGGSKQSASFGFRYSSTYGNEVPREGFNTEIRFGFVNKSADIDSISAFSQQFIKAHAENFITIGKQGVLASRLNSFFLISDRFTDIDLIRFGGANSLRGFTEEQFQASQLVWGDIEYRFLTNPTSYLFGFAAAGWFHRPQLLTESNTQFKTDEFVESLGFGLSYKVRVGRLKFTYAISPSDALGNGKVHLALRTNL